MTQDCVVGVFGRLADAQDAIAQLKHGGINLAHISLVSRGEERELEAAQNANRGDRMEKTATVGAAAGAALGLLVGSSLFLIPGLGPVVFAGAMASGITGGLVGGLVGAMSGWGVHENHVRQYEEDVRNGKTIILVDGQPPELAAARSILQEARAEKVTFHAESADSTVNR